MEKEQFQRPLHNNKRCNVCTESQKKKRKRMELKFSFFGNESSFKNFHYFENDGKLKFVKMHQCADSSG